MQSQRNFGKESVICVCGGCVLNRWRCRNFKRRQLGLRPEIRPMVERQYGCPCKRCQRCAGYIRRRRAKAG